MLETKGRRSQACGDVELEVPPVCVILAHSHLLVELDLEASTYGPQFKPRPVHFAGADTGTRIRRGGARRQNGRPSGRGARGRNGAEALLSHPISAPCFSISDAQQALSSHQTHQASTAEIQTRLRVSPW